MAAPQLENGYLRVANELAEALARSQFSPYESRVIWAVLRLTYGYSKKADFMSYGQIADLTGISRRNVIRTVQALVSRKTLRSVASDTSKVNIISINKDFESWVVSPSTPGSVSADTTGVVSHETPPGSVSADTHHIQRKRQKKRTPASQGQESGTTPSSVSEADASEHGSPPSSSDADVLRQVWATVPHDLRESITAVMKALPMTRATGKMADSVKVAVLRKLLEYDPAKVKAGIATYLDRACHLHHKKENYLFGIIRNATPEEMGTMPAVVHTRGNGTGGPPAHIGPQPKTYRDCRDMEQRIETARIKALKEKVHGRKSHPEQRPGGHGDGPAQSPAHAGQSHQA